MADRSPAANIDLTRWVAAGLLLVLLAGCGGDAPSAGSGRRLPDTFTFFQVDANSTDGEALRKTLGGHLGPEAVAGKDVLDLGVFPRVDLVGVFPDLDALNRQLNPDPRARKEHDITSLTYRYPQKHYPTFTFVRLVFSALNRHPLMIVIDANSEAAGTLETLQSKYGPPLVTRLEGDDATFWSWERDGDRLVVQKHRNKFGRPEYLIAIFYVERMRELLDAESRKGGAPENASKEKQAF